MTLEGCSKEYAVVKSHEVLMTLEGFSKEYAVVKSHEGSHDSHDSSLEGSTALMTLYYSSSLLQLVFTTARLQPAHLASWTARMTLLLFYSVLFTSCVTGSLPVLEPVLAAVFENF